jgi:hypothetical protein
VIGAGGRTAVEFKYFTSTWQGVDPNTNEHFRLAEHAAHDLARLYFVTDLVRLDRFCSEDPETDGLAILLTNYAGLWADPSSTQRPTNYQEFRIHERQALTGTLRWAAGKYKANERTLTGTYVTRWTDYSELPGKHGRFRWLAVAVPRAA